MLNIHFQAVVRTRATLAASYASTSIMTCMNVTAEKVLQWAQTDTTVLKVLYSAMGLVETNTTQPKTIHSFKYHDCLIYNRCPTF